MAHLRRFAHYYQEPSASGIPAQAISCVVAAAGPVALNGFFEPGLIAAMSEDIGEFDACRIRIEQLRLDCALSCCTELSEVGLRLLEYVWSSQDLVDT